MCREMGMKGNTCMEVKEYIDISIVCCSQINNAMLGGGFSYEDDGQEVNLTEGDWTKLFKCMAESFWENYSEFEEGIIIAKETFASGQKSSIYEALYEQFGEFIIEYRSNEEMAKLEDGKNAEIQKHIYELLSRNCEI